MKRTLRNFIFTLSGVLLLFTACNKDESDDSSSNVPYVAVNVTININSSAFNTLTKVGGVAYLTNVGYRGIVLYRYSVTSITAFDRTCTYDLPDANAIIYALNNGTAECPDCGSIYSLYDGTVNIGPTTIGLTRYTTAFNINTGLLAIAN